MTSFKEEVIVPILLVSLSPYSVFCITLHSTRCFTRHCTFYISLLSISSLLMGAGVVHE